MSGNLCGGTQQGEPVQLHSMWLKPHGSYQHLCSFPKVGLRPETSSTVLCRAMTLPISLKKKKKAF